MTRDEYERDICARSETASFVNVKRDAGFDGWEPKVGGCHDNVDHWVKHHTGHTAVRGWIAYMSGGPDHVVYTAHSVVRGPDGELFDITPLYNNDELRGRFITHTRDDATFLAMRIGSLIDIRCQGNCPEPPFDPMWALQHYEPEPEEGL
ncbi:hypothetical protein [Rhizobium laguerreae]|uniref:hypothetical protein n=1 Tax=Rhizobium laguerreae TaxID=1076926 RepID=UPI001C917DAF|nr:hypothetical protein [Rhizobium laguerreae]MBY3205040.1 hypothetical protein [Rhizobium laguerreae]MBY3273124.1 hypothetical protein [Rhizobium laguerreae]